MNRLLWLCALSLLELAVSLGCSGSSPRPSTGPIAPTPTSAVTVNGRVISLQGGEPVSGATMTLASGSGTVFTDSAGAFSLTALPGILEISVTAQGYLNRQAYLNAAAARSDASVDMISTVSPFSLEYYRDFVRGARDNVGRLLPVARWTEAPRVFFVTATTDTGDPVPDEVIDVMEEIARVKMPQFTGGRFLPAQMARGSQRPVPEQGWIIVESFTNGIPGFPGAGGTGQVGTNPGRIRLVLNTTRFSGGDCVFGMAGAFAHELVHALGFWHVSAGSWTVGNQCRQALPEAEYHGRIAYSRPVGNADPDSDPRSATPAAVSVIR